MFYGVYIYKPIVLNNRIFISIFLCRFLQQSTVQIPKFRVIYCLYGHRNSMFKFAWCSFVSYPSLHSKQSSYNQQRFSVNVWARIILNHRLPHTFYCKTLMKWNIVMSFNKTHSVDLVEPFSGNINVRKWFQLNGVTVYNNSKN